MVQVSAADAAKLRKMTGAGMMDCKKALEETGGDFEKAADVIRKRGLLVASKRADRDANEGCVLASISADGKFGVVTALNSETEFVAKNADFIALAESINKIALESKPANIDALKSTQVNGRTVSDLITDKVGITGEKMDLSFFGSVQAEKVIAYIHPGNQLATIVGFNKAGMDEQVYKDVAMQVAAMFPVAVDKDSIAADVLEKEREIGRDQARQEGKPENMIEKIAEGKLQKFVKERTLLNQEYIKDNKKTIAQFLQSIDKDLTVTAFKRFGLKD